jgi:bleomycin hydrolase
MSYAQADKAFVTLIRVPSTPLKDQQSSGTCWSFATTSFIETEAMRLGKLPVVLSPMFYVHPTYIDKARTYIETKGATYFDAGDLTFSVLKAYDAYGAIPEVVYNGIIEEDWQHDHVEMDDLLKRMVASIGTSGYGRIKPNSWSLAMEGVLHAYLGKAPAAFVYKGKLYSPQSFARTHIGITASDYIEVTSYTQSAFYDWFVLDIPANWGQNRYLNIPIKDFEHMIDYALEQGYSLAWDGDASEAYFDFDQGILELSPEEERFEITQDLRQKTFEDKTTTDDHNMHLIGKAKDQNGKFYYILKNSEGSNAMDGYIYMSKNTLLLKTISLLVHKEGIPESIRKRSHIKL